MSLKNLIFFMVIYKLLTLILDRYAYFICELLSFRTKAQLNLLLYVKLFFLLELIFNNNPIQTKFVISELPP